MVEDKDPLGSQSVDLDPSELLGESRETVSGPEQNLEEGKKFLFGGDVAASFEEDVISRQIPGYREFRWLVNNVTQKFVRPGHCVVDLGTSQGKVLTDLARIVAQNGLDPYRGVIGQPTHLIGLESEPDMVTEAEFAFKKVTEELDLGSTNIRLDVRHHDLRQGIGALETTPTLFTSVFTVQFIPIEHRPRLLTEIYDRLEPGGAFLLAEKVVEESVKMDDLLTELYYASKARNGLSREAIVKKRASLEGFLMPFTHEANVQLLTGAGFQPRDISTVWRNLQFEAILAIKR